MTMERLEAALEKARESRRSVLQTKGRVQGRHEIPRAAELWHVLPQFKVSNMAAKKHRITAIGTTKGTNSYDLLRSRTLRLMQENGWKTLAVTSPNASCGKTTVCANLAFALARQQDVRVLVFDFDMRRPAMHKILSQRPQSSLHEALQGKVRIADLMVRYGENLAFGLNNRACSNPSELLQSKQTHERLRQIVADYQPDFVIYDLPPMLASDDHVGFLPHVDCALLVGAADSTTLTQLDNCEKELAELTNVLGVVLNKCRFPDEDTAYDYEYA